MESVSITPQTSLKFTLGGLPAAQGNLRSAMATALILGGAGKIAQHLTRILLSDDETPHTIYSIIRKADQADEIRSLGAIPIVLDLEKATLSELASEMRRVQPNVVFWCAGAPFNEPGRVEAVDHHAQVKAMDACAEALPAARRFISVSMLDLRKHELPCPKWYDEADEAASKQIWHGRLKPWLVAKLAADLELREGNDRRGLEYTIVRPGRLGADSGAGTVGAGQVNFAGKMVDREDLARVLAECARNRDTIDLAFDVVSGEEPVAEAVARAGRGKKDTFPIE